MPAPDRHHASDRGFLLVAVLWIVSALAALASIYAAYVANTAVAIAVHDETIRADALVTASAELVAYRLLSVPAEERPTHGAFDFRLGRANVAVDFRTEAARIDVNVASKEVLAGLFTVLGAQSNEAEQYADRIIGWRTKPTSASQDLEASLYGAAGLDYGPRGGPFAHVGELNLVLGIPPAMVERALPYVTIFSGQPDVDLLEAAPEVLAAVPRTTREQMNAASAAPGRD
jgi:general secretion pathway protein K